MEIKNAKIESTMLGYEDHGIFTCMIYLDYGGSGQGFGGYALDGEHKSWQVMGNYGSHFIRKILDTVGVEKWEDLVGKHVRVEAEFDKIHRIGNILQDKWFDPKVLDKDSIK